MITQVAIKDLIIGNLYWEEKSKYNYKTNCDIVKISIVRIEKVNFQDQNPYLVLKKEPLQKYRVFSNEIGFLTELKYENPKFQFNESSYYIFFRENIIRFFNFSENYFLKNKSKILCFYHRGSIPRKTLFQIIQEIENNPNFKCPHKIK